MPNCPFCQIIAGTADATIVAETTTSIAIIPRDPVTGDAPGGHVLVIPRQHVADFIESESITATTMADAAYVARLLRNAHGGAWNLITSAGADATQTVFHLHVHLVRRVAGDGLHLPWTGQAKRSDFEQYHAQRMAELEAKGDCPHGYRYTDSCPGCDHDEEIQAEHDARRARRDAEQRENWADNPHNLFNTGGIL